MKKIFTRAEIDDENFKDRKVPPESDKTESILAIPTIMNVMMQHMEPDQLLTMADAAGLSMNLELGIQQRVTYTKRFVS